MNFRDKAVIFLATGCFVGKIPFAPGTWGSMAGLPICWLLSQADVPGAVLGVLLIVALAVWVAGQAEKILAQKDPGCIVVDEIAGILITLIGLPWNVTSVCAGFFIFRILDIVKPFPISWFEKKFSGGIGIVGDDVMAGILGNLILRMFLRLMA